MLYYNYLTQGMAMTMAVAVVMVMGRPIVIATQVPSLIQHLSQRLPIMATTLIIAMGITIVKRLDVSVKTIRELVINICRPVFVT